MDRDRMLRKRLNRPNFGSRPNTECRHNPGGIQEEGQLSTSTAREMRSSVEIEEIVTAEASTSATVVDLTKDNAVMIPDVVDLTDNAIVELDLTPPKRSRRSRRLRSSPNDDSGGNVVLSSDSDESDDLILLNSPDFLDRPSRLPVDTLPSPSGSIPSPQKLIKCPICLDDDSKIKSSGRNLMSTNCGHIFCETCIKTAINAQHKCPTCRKNCP